MDILHEHKQTKNMDIRNKQTKYIDILQKRKQNKIHRYPT